MNDENKRPGRKPGGKNKVKNASKIIKNHQEKMKSITCECELGKAVSHSPNCRYMNETFNKNHQDELNKAKGERIKNDIEDGENFTGI